jgi:hypothetical protein
LQRAAGPYRWAMSRYSSSQFDAAQVAAVVLIVEA